METGPNWTGGLYECNQRAIVSRRGQKVVIAEDGKREVTKLADGAELLKLIKPHDWNQCEIIARGPEIVYKINGTVMTQVIDREKGQGRRRGADHAPTAPRQAHESPVQEHPHQELARRRALSSDSETHSQRPNRRDFLRTSAAAAAAGISLPCLIPSRVLGGPDQPGANETVRVGIIGCGGRARDVVVNDSKDVKGFRPVAACDCFLPRAEAFVKILGRPGDKPTTTSAR